MTELIVNGTFDQFNNATDLDPTGWTVTETNSQQVQVISTSGRLGFNRGSSPAGSSIEQVVNGVNIGQTVNFKLNYFENGGGGNPSVKVELFDANNNLVLNQTLTTTGTGINFNFTAASTSYRVKITDTSTGNLGAHDANIDNVSFNVLCFGPGTLIETTQGPKPVEDLQLGDMLDTHVAGPQALRWLAKTEVSAEQQRQEPKLRPILFPAGSLGQGLPEQDLRLSRQHRVLLRSNPAKRLFGSAEILVPAHRLVGHNGIQVDDSCQDLCYYHILTAQHDLLIANGALCESLLPGKETIKTLGANVVEHLLATAADLRDSFANPQPVRPIVHKAAEVQHLLYCLVKNSRALFERSLGKNHPPAAQLIAA